jgi:protein-disulfide isomerase
MFFKLNKWCPLCLTAHICSLIIFVCAALLWPRRPAPAAIEQADDLPASATDENTVVPSIEPTTEQHWPDVRSFVYALILILLVVNTEHLYLGLIGQKRIIEREKLHKDYYKKSFERYDNKAAHTYTSWWISPMVKISTEGLPFRGAAKARHTIVMYSDFLCPSCYKFEQWLNDTVMPLGEKSAGWKFVFKPWPICQDCNPTDKRNLHPKACEASYAAEAARIVGGDKAFWKMYDLLWEHQAEIKKGLAFEELAGQIGLNVETFVKAMNSDEVRQRVKASIDEGINLGQDLLGAKELTEKKRKTLKDDLEWVKVNSTPAVFIDGKRLNNPRHVSTWKNILRLPSPQQMKRPRAPQSRPSK